MPIHPLEDSGQALIRCAVHLKDINFLGLATLGQDSVPYIYREWRLPEFNEELVDLCAKEWLRAVYLLMTARKGISVLQLKYELKVSYETAWYTPHRLRLACGDNLEILHGEVRIDASYLGGTEKNKHAHKKLNAGSWWYRQAACSWNVPARRQA